MKIGKNEEKDRRKNQEMEMGKHWEMKQWEYGLREARWGKGKMENEVCIEERLKREKNGEIEKVKNEEMGDGWRS